MKLFKSKREKKVDDSLGKAREILDNSEKLLANVKGRLNKHKEDIITLTEDFNHQKKVIEVQKEEMAAKDRLIYQLRADLTQNKMALRDLEVLYGSRKKQLEKSREEAIHALEYKGKYLALLKNL